MERDHMIDDFLAGEAFAVAGASQDRSKYGNRVLRSYREHGRRAFAVNPKEREIEGEPAYPDLLSLPEPVHGLSIVTPPRATREVVRQALEAGIRRIWMQPGAEDPEAIETARAAGAAVLHGGPCVLVEFRRISRP